MRRCFVFRRRIHCALLLLCLLSLACYAQPTKQISGNQSGTWSRDTIYVLSGTVTVPANQTLIIQSGAEVRFPNYSYNLIINGTLKASGTVTDSIRFKGRAAGTVSNYGGTVFFNAGSDSSVLSYIRVDSLGDNDYNGDAGAFYINSPAKPTITNCFFGRTESSMNISIWSGGAERISHVNGIIGIRAGNVSINSVLVKQEDNTSYRLFGTLTVNSGISLTLNPGVLLEFPNYSYNLIVNGKLKAIGSATDSIRFKGKPAGTVSNYGGSVFFNAGSDSSVLNYVRVDSLGDNDYNGEVGAFYVNSPAKPAINNCLFGKTESSMNISSWAGGAENISQVNGIIGLRAGAVDLNCTLVKQASNASYRLLGSITISAGITLKMNPGVLLEFPNYSYNLIINGTLKAVGTVTDSIRFQGKPAGTVSNYGGTVFFNNGSDSSILSHVRVDSLGDNDYNGDAGAFYIYSPAKPTITNCFFGKTESSINVSTWSGGAEHIDLVNGIIGLRSGNVAINSILVKQNGNASYKMMGSLTVNNGITLTIKPGARLEFPNYSYNLVINGTLNAVGTATDSIRFQGKPAGTASNYGGTVFFKAGSDSSVLSYIRVDSLGDNDYNGDAGAFYIYSPAKPTITNCFFGNTEASMNISIWSGGAEKVGNVNGIIGIRAGNIDLSSTLVKQASNASYRLLGTVTLNSGVSLIMNPGVLLEFPNYSYNLIVNGKLKAIGSATDSIYFKGKPASTASNYGGTVFFNNGSDSSILSYVRVDSLGDNDYNGDAGALYIYSPAKPTITNSRFTNTESSVNISTWMGGAEKVNQVSGIIGLRAGNVSINSTLVKQAPSASYRLLGDVTVNTGVTVTMQPGVVIDFYSSFYDLTVNGTLKAVGTDAEPIQFGKTVGSGNYGGSINFTGTSNQSVLNYVTVSKLGSNANTSKAVIVQTSNITIINTRITNNESYGLNITGNAAPFISNCTIANNPTGVYVSSGNPVFRNCNITGNISYGINNASPVITDTVDARNCWWGSPKGPKHATNPGGNGDVVSNRVKFDGYRSDSVVISLRDQTITFTPVGTKTFGDVPFLLKATASSGLPVSYTIVSGPAILSKDTVTIMGAGTIIVEASQVGDSAYNPATPVRQNIVVAKALQEVVFDVALDSMYVGTRYLLSATASSGLPVRFSVFSGYGAIAKDTLSFTGAGTVIIRAIQDGNQNYVSAYEEKTFCISGGDPGPITGLTTACRTTQEYKVARRNGVLYKWMVTSGGTLLSTTGDSVRVSWTGLGDQALTVTAYSACDTMNKQSRSIAVRVIDTLNVLPATNLSPPDNTILNAFPTNFSWRPPANASLYDLFIWPVGSPQPATPVVGNITSITYPVSDDNIPSFGEGNQYNWMVTAKNGCSATPSAVQQFSIGALPDLIVKSIHLADSVFSGTVADVTVEIANVGGAATNPGDRWVDEYYLSQDSTFVHQRDDYLGSSTNPTSLGPQQSYTTTFHARLPKERVGDYYLLVFTNSSISERSIPRIGESTRSNNVAAKKFKIKLTEPADLIVDSVFSRQDAFSGDSIAVSFKVRNPGKHATEDSLWRDDIFISPSPVFNPQEAIKLGSVTHRRYLKADSSYTATATVVIPTKIFGTYYFHVYTDANDNIYEYLFENNNTTSGESVHIILTAPPDFVVSQFNAPSGAVGGETITLDYTVGNQGANKPGRLETTWMDAILLSSDSVFHKNNSLLLKTLRVQNEQPNLVYGTGYHRTVSVTIPRSFTGKSYLYAYTDYFNDVFEYLKEDSNYRRSTIQINNPDLVVSNPIILGTPSSGNTLDVDWTIKNTGHGKVLPVERTDLVWLSATPVFSPNTATKIAAITYSSALDTAGSLTMQLSVTLPDSVSGLRYLFVQADTQDQITEENESNNTSTPVSLTIALSPYPDLAVDTVQVSSDTLVAEKAYTLTYSVSDISAGEVVGKTWKDKIFWSSDPQFNGSAKELASIDQSRSLFSTQSYTQQHSVSIALGDFGLQDTLRRYFYVQTDANNNVYENGNKGNNIRRSKEIVIVHEPYPDLLVTAASGSDSVRAGKKASVQGTIRNQGGIAGLSSYWYDAVLFSKDTIPDEKDLVAATKIVLASPDAPLSYDTKIDFIVPNGISGNYFMLLVSDFSKLNQDKNRANNYKVVRVKVGPNGENIPVDVVLPPSADLVVNAFTAPTIGYAGKAYWVKWKVKNQGRDATSKAAWKENIYLSTDDKVGNGDQVLQTYAHTGILSKDSSYTDSTLVFLPSGITGNYFLLFKTDGDNVIYENNAEDNNTASSVIFIIAQSPCDLVVTNVTTPAQALLGDSITVGFNIRNTGFNPASGYIRLGIYSSTDSLWDKDDILLASPMLNLDLPVLEERSFSVRVKLKSTLPNRNYILVRADLLNNIVETDETNNTAASLQALQINVPNLPVNVLTPAVLRNNEELYYKIEVPANLENGTLLVTLKGDSVNTANELYIRHDSIPSRIAFDFAYDKGLSGEQNIIIPSLKKDTYYLLVYGTSPRPQQNITLLATPIDFVVRDVDAKEGGNAGNVTVKITGARFEEGMTVMLNNGSLGAISASKIKYVNSLTLFATFNLKGARSGTYDLSVVKANNNSASQANAFKIVSSDSIRAAGGTQANGFYCYLKPDDIDSLNTYVAYNSWERITFPFLMTVEYGNAGNIDIPIPQIILQSLDNAPVGLESVLIRGVVNLLLALNEKNGPDVLRPGAKGSIQVFSLLSIANQAYRYRLIQQ